MFFQHLRNELWKLFGKKRTYIGFGAFLLAQTAMLLIFRFTNAQKNMERMLSGNGYLAQNYVSALTVAVVMLAPQIILLMPLYAALVAVNASVILGLGFMFSCFNMKPAAATILALSFMFANFVMEQIPYFQQYREWLLTYHFHAWLLLFAWPIPWERIVESLSVLIA